MIPCKECQITNSFGGNVCTPREKNFIPFYLSSEHHICCLRVARYFSCHILVVLLPMHHDGSAEKNKTKEKKQMWKTSVNFLNCAAYENSTWRQEVFSCATRYMTCINPNISHNADILVLEISWKNDDTLENEWNFSQAHSFSWKRMNLNISCFFHTCFGRFSRTPMHRDTLIVHLIIVQT